MVVRLPDPPSPACHRACVVRPAATPVTAGSGSLTTMCSRSAPGGPGRANELGGQMVDLLTLAVFATIDEAAISGLKHAAAICDPQYECGGVVRARSEEHTSELQSLTKLVCRL